MDEQGIASLYYFYEFFKGRGQESLNNVQDF